MRNLKSLKLAIAGVGIALNIIGAFIALNLRLPIYLDSIGTIMVGFILGPVYGMITGVLGSLVSGITFDIYSLYFAPVQIFTGFFAGYFYSKGLMKGKKLFFAIFIMTLFVSFIGAFLTAYILGGITSSGSSYIIVVLNNLGVNPVVSAFITQFLTDYLDKLVAVLIMLQVVLRLPKSILLNLYNN